MSPLALSTVLAFAAVTFVAAQESTFPATPLYSKKFSYPTGIPYRADTDTNLIRGPQFGYNLCNKTTENQNSLCQTSFLNAADDFCLWAPSKPNSDIADTEGEEVAWCTKPGRGTRLIPATALQGIQFMETPDYIQIVGFIDQTQINLKPDDFGGELDPHGADLRGNPLGGLMYSTFWSGNNNTYQQVPDWHNFMGGNTFCLKLCKPGGPHAADYCQHIYDRIGCAYNAPNAAKNGTFEACHGDDQDFPGVYTSNGKVVTYTQPPESLGAISTMPYQPKVPASSNCVQFQSSSLFAALASVTPTGGAAATGGGASGGSSKAGGGATATGTAAGSKPSSNDANVIAFSMGVSILGVVFSALFLS